ncbi:MAG TPA: MarR family transcriptional regulator [Longimicrobiales bacterium]|nr:MarR family transcriptional regulator [Longimicrobiales bacterium]
MDLGTAKQTCSLEDAHRVIVSLLSAADAMRRHLGAAVAERGLTLQQYNVLRILRSAAARGPMPTMEICEHMIEKTPGVTRFMDRLEEMGLIERRRCTEDRRQVHASITEAGLAVLAELDARVQEADERSVAGLSPAEVDTLVAHLETIRDNTS